MVGGEEEAVHRHVPGVQRLGQCVRVRLERVVVPGGDERRGIAGRDVLRDRRVGDPRVVLEVLLTGVGPQEIALGAPHHPVGVVGDGQVVGAAGQDHAAQLRPLQRLWQPGGSGVVVVGDGQGRLRGDVRPRGVAGQHDPARVDVQAVGPGQEVLEGGSDLLHLERVAALGRLGVLDRGHRVAVGGEDLGVGGGPVLGAGDECSAVHPHDRGQRLLGADRVEHVQARVGVVRRVRLVDHTVARSRRPRPRRPLRRPRSGAAVRAQRRRPVRTTSSPRPCTAPPGSHQEILAVGPEIVAGGAPSWASHSQTQGRRPSQRVRLACSARSPRRSIDSGPYPSRTSSSARSSAPRCVPTWPRMRRRNARA